MSRRLQIDFVAAPAQGPRALAWLALVLVALALVAVVDWRQQLHGRVAAAAQRVDDLQQRSRPAATPRPQALDPDAVRRLQRANEVIDQLTVPWDALLDRLEAAPRRGVQLLQLLPNPKDRTLQLTGEAASLPHVLAYAEQLAQQPLLSTVHLVSHDTQLRDGVQVVGFALSARWRQP